MQHLRIGARVRAATLAFAATAGGACGGSSAGAADLPLAPPSVPAAPAAPAAPAPLPGALVVTTGRWGAVVSGGTETLAVTVLDARGLPLEPAPRPRFVSRHPDVVRVDSLGRVTGVRPGTATIVATLAVGAREVSDSVTVPHVVPMPIPLATGGAAR